MQQIEIERKFWIEDPTTIPNEVFDSGKEIEQTYLANEGDWEIRVRIINKRKGFLTIKSKPHLVRTEVENELPLEHATLLMKQNRKNGVIAKRRYKWINPDDQREWSFDVFQGDLNGLYMAEVEMKNENEIVSVPHFMAGAIEVTGMPGFYNSNIARMSYDYTKMCELVIRK